VPERLHLPRGSLVRAITEAASILAKTSGISAESTSVAASIFTKAARLTTEAGIKTGVRLVVGAVVPLNGGGVLRPELLKEVGNLLLGLNQNLDQVLADVLVTIIVEGGSLALIADTRGAADAVNILGDPIMLSRGQIVVDDVLDVGDIEAARRNTSRDKDGAPSRTEGAPAWC
jgi:hypothetical protein